MTPRHTHFFAAVTVVPGAIGYLSYAVRQDAEVALMFAIAALGDLLMRRLIISIRRALQDAEQELEYALEFVAACAVVLVGLLLLALAAEGLLAEIALADVLAAAATAAERLLRLITESGLRPA